MRKNAIKLFGEEADTSLIVILCFGLGIFAGGIGHILDFVLTAILNFRCEWVKLLYYLIDVLISIAIGGLASLYWRFIFVKTGALHPQFHGFAYFPGAIAFFAGTLIGLLLFI